MSHPPRQDKRPELPTIPGYILERELGRGTSGVVYQATQVSVNRKVALKVMHTGLGANGRSIRRLQREARIAAHLAHPSLIAAIDMGQSGQHWWFAMELVQGPTLAERLEKGGRLAEKEALRIFIQLSDALQHASEKGVVHRDVKPANILLERPDFPRLVDLGLARIEDDPLLTRTGSTLGTPHYISPEQARDPSVADVRSDIWSLGATLFHTVCGKPPFAGSSTAEILSSVLYGAIPDPAELRPELSKGLTLILRKCLSRDPNLRYFAPAELKADLQRVLDHRAPQINRRALEPLDPTRRPSVSLAAGIGAVVCLGLLVAIVLWARGERDARGGTEAATQQSVLPWAPLIRFNEHYRDGQGSLAAAFAELSELEPRVPKHEQAQWEAAHSMLKRRLQSELGDFWAETSKDLSERLKASEFDWVEKRLDQGLAQSLLRLTGFTPESLPRKIDRESFRRRTESERLRLDANREDAMAAAVAGLERYVRGSILPKVDRSKRSGDWSEARALAGADVGEFWVSSGANLKGLDRRQLRTQLAPLQAELDAQVKHLEEAWAKLDGSTLLTQVQGLAARAQLALRGGAGVQVLDAFGRDFDQLLAGHGLDRSQLAAAPVHHSLDEFRERRSELEDRADEIAAERGKELLASLDGLAKDFLLRRDYEGLSAFWRAHESEPVLASLEDQLAIRLEGARELLEFLQTAALGIKRKGGARVSLPEGAIKVPGTVLLRGEPLEVGFRLMISGSATTDYLLRGNRASPGKILDPRAVEQFAMEGAALSSEEGLPLQRALFRYHEGDIAGARELLSEADLQSGDLILHDLGVRVSKQLGQEQEVRRMRRVHASREVERLIGRDSAPLPDKERAVHIGRLLREYRDVIDTNTQLVLTRTRAGLTRVLPPSTLKDFDERYAPQELEFPQYGRVRMAFHFDRTEILNWSTGEWFYTGAQGWLGSTSASVEELGNSRGPRLELSDPLLPETGIFEVQVRFLQPAGADPVMLAVSTMGYHAVFTGRTLTDSPRFLCDTTDLIDVGRRARAGEGSEFEGFEPGREHQLVLRISKASGKVSAWVDGEPVETHHRQPPRADAGPLQLMIRSLEPIELRKVQIEAGRR